MKKTIHLPEDLKALAAAMSQVLDDMRKDATSVCLATKAQARIANEPFADPDEKSRIMPIEEARRIIEELS
jgi:hypothetical protein